MVIEHEPPAWKTKPFPLTLQQNRTVFFPGTDCPDSCTVTKSATLSRFSLSKTFYSKQEHRTAFRHRTLFVLFLVKETTSKIFGVNLRTSCINTGGEKNRRSGIGKNTIKNSVLRRRNTMFEIQKIGTLAMTPDTAPEGIIHNV
jgi:hypothetical protein